MPRLTHKEFIKEIEKESQKRKETMDRLNKAWPPQTATPDRQPVKPSYFARVFCCHCEMR